MEGRCDRCGAEGTALAFAGLAGGRVLVALCEGCYLAAGDLALRQVRLERGVGRFAERATRAERHYYFSVRVWRDGGHWLGRGRAG